MKTFQINIRSVSINKYIVDGGNILDNIMDILGTVSMFILGISDIWAGG